MQYTFEGVSPDSIVFDIGLFKGNWSEKIAQKYDPTIYGFEPVGEFYQDAKKGLAEYPKVKLFNFGLGKETRQAPIFVNGTLTSLINETGQPLREVVEIKSIRDVMSEFDIDFVDLASINIEGGEYELLDYMIIAGLIPKFGSLFIQFHEVNGFHRVDIREKLKLTHKMVYSYDTVWDYWVKRE